jgi:Raf kinase inhibitor-like YbhB/YbcL family protein
MSDRDYDPYARLDPVPGFTLTSEDILDGQPLKADQYGSDSGGQDVSPQLAWEGAPEGTKSYAVTVYDPDAPTGSGFWHWAVANLPATVTSLPAGAGSEGGSLPDGALVLPNELRLKHFIGATPPQGTGVHRYYVVVHAVDVPRLELDPESTPAVLGFNLHFHTLGRAILVGTGEYGGAAAGSPGV